MSLKKLTLFALLLTFSLVLGACSDDDITNKDEYKIYGTVTVSDENGDVVDPSTVAISISGDTNGTITPGNDGKWQAVVKGDITVEPIKEGYAFTPSSRTIASSTNTADFTGQPGAPEASPAAAAYLVDQTVTLTYEEVGYTIYYTLDDTLDANEIATSGIEYTEPITVPLDTTLRAVAVDDNGAKSGVLTAEYQSLDGALAAKYSFDGDLTDSTGAFADGTVIGAKIGETGGSMSYGTGVLGQAAVFNAATGVQLANNLINDHDYTISMWLNPSAVTNFTTTFFGAVDGENWISLMPSDGSQIKLWANNGVYYDDAVTSVAATTNKWTHVAITVDEGTVTLYIDGEAKVSADDFPDIFSGNTNSFYLGVNWWDTPYNGMMDELKVYDNTLSADAIASLYADVQ